MLVLVAVVTLHLVSLGTCNTTTIIPKHNTLCIISTPLLNTSYPPNISPTILLSPPLSSQHPIHRLNPLSHALTVFFASHHHIIVLMHYSTIGSSHHHLIIIITSHHHYIIAPSHYHTISSSQQRGGGRGLCSLPPRDRPQ